MPGISSLTKAYVEQEGKREINVQEIQILPQLKKLWARDFLIRILKFVVFAFRFINSVNSNLLI